MSIKSTQQSTSEPEIVLSSLNLSTVNDSIARTIRSIADITDAQRATLAVTIEKDGASASDVESNTRYSYQSAYNAFSILEENGLATITDGRPKTAVPTDDATQAVTALNEEFDTDFSDYLHEEQDQEQEQEDEDEEPIPSPSPSSGSSSSSSSSSKPKPQGFADRPAASWDEEAPDVSGSEVGPNLLELSAEMLSKAQQPRMSNLEREHVRAEQAMAAALLKMAADD